VCRRISQLPVRAWLWTVWLPTGAAWCLSSVAPHQYRRRADLRQVGPHDPTDLVIELRVGLPFQVADITGAYVASNNAYGSRGGASYGSEGLVVLFNAVFQESPLYEEFPLHKAHGV
jgi:hypothetical protein